MGVRQVGMVQVVRAVLLRARRPLSLDGLELPQWWWELLGSSFEHQSNVSVLRIVCKLPIATPFA